MKNNPLFVFFGTPDVAVCALDALERHGYMPALVVSAPDKPRGRGQTLSTSPTKAWALAQGVAVITPTTLKEGTTVGELANTDWDFFVVAAYAKLLPKAVLNIPKQGCLNIHPSLLPKFRGPSPILSAILADERETGVTIMQMTEGMDAGPIVAQARVEIDASEWPISNTLLSQMLFTEGGNLLAEIIPQWLKGKIIPEEQDETQATYTKKFSDSDAHIDSPDHTGRFTLPLQEQRKLLLKIKAFDATAPARAHFFTPEGQRVIVTDTSLTEEGLKILRVIPEGKKEMSFREFSASHAKTL